MHHVLYTYRGTGHIEGEKVVLLERLYSGQEPWACQATSYKGCPVSQILLCEIGLNVTNENVLLYNG